jgi:TPR repeat protein
MRITRQVIAFIRAHKKAAVSAGLVVSFLLGTIFGQGALFQWFSYKAASVKANQDLVELEANLMERLNGYETEIHKVVPAYLAKRDATPAAASSEERLEYAALQSQLVALFISYNKLEARLSALEARDPQFLLSTHVIRPRAPTISSVDQVPSEDGRSTNLTIHLEPLRRDDVEVEVSQRITQIFDQYNEASRDAHYMRACRSGAASLCTRLAFLHSGGNVERPLPQQDRDLYELGCSLGDAHACEMLAFLDFNQKKYKSTEDWLTKACSLNSADGCGFLGALYASKESGDRRNAEAARRNLDKACQLMLSPQACYHLAILLISGLVEKDPSLAKAQLERACDMKLDEACKSLSQFAEFQRCSQEAIHSIPGDGAKLTIECKEPTDTKY